VNSYNAALVLVNGKNDENKNVLSIFGDANLIFTKGSNLINIKIQKIIICADICYQ